jgi:hypothetical protein
MCLRRSEGKNYLRRGAGFCRGATILQQAVDDGSAPVKK